MRVIFCPAVPTSVRHVSVMSISATSHGYLMVLFTGGGSLSLHSPIRVQSRGSGARTARRCSGRSSCGGDDMAAVCIWSSSGDGTRLGSAGGEGEVMSRLPSMLSL